MKQIFDITAALKVYHSLLAGWVLLLTGLFGAYWYLFAALLLFNVLDWLTGWYRAYRMQQESSKIGLQGIIKKLLYWVLVAVAFTVAAVLSRIGTDILGVDLAYLELLGWFVLANLTINEARSILENLVQLGVSVPVVLTDGLQIAADLVKQGKEKGDSNG